MKKVSVNLTENNVKKMKAVIASEGISQTEFINTVIETSAIICMGNRKTLAQSFVELIRLSSSGHTDEVREEVLKVCQSLNSLMEEIKALQH